MRTPVLPKLPLLTLLISFPLLVAGLIQKDPPSIFMGLVLFALGPGSWLFSFWKGWRRR